MQTYRAALVGCSRMGAFIDNEVAGSPGFIPPYSHAAGYEAVERTRLVALCDVRPEALQKAGERYGVAPAHQYTDYRELILKEKPDILSIATQPEQRAEIALFAVQNGVRALYCDKALCASMAEADALVAAVEQAGAAFNLGTQRRWDPGYAIMKRIIHSGELGALRALICYNTSTLFNNASHFFDLLLYLNDDRPVQWVQGSLLSEPFDGDLITDDPQGHAIMQSEGGVYFYALDTNRTAEMEAVCEEGTVACLNNGQEWEIRRKRKVGERRFQLVREAFPEHARHSGTRAIILDLVQALDTGRPTQGGVRQARASTELIFAVIESHRRGGARVELPLTDCNLRLARNALPKQPKYTV